MANNPNTPYQYIKFTVKFKCFWIWMNMFNIIASIGMALGGVMIMGRE